MREIRISDRIRYIEATDTPLSADIGFVEDGGRLWLYDVGDGERAAAGLTGSYRVVLSHFHRDHTGNLPKIRAEELYVSRETYLHAHAGTVVEGERRVGDLRIFSLPSSHCKGCLGLEVAETYAFVGDALYCRVKNGFRFYNAQLLKARRAERSALPVSARQPSARAGPGAGGGDRRTAGDLRAAGEEFARDPAAVRRRMR